MTPKRTSAPSSTVKPPYTTSSALALVTGGGVALYLAAWLLIPGDGEDQPVAGAWIAGRRDRIR